MLALAGCFPKTFVSDEPNFCDLTEDRVFTKEEWEWRVANAPENLRYQIEQNETRSAECP